MVSAALGPLSRARAGAAWPGVALALAACGPSLPLPRPADHEGAEPVIVPEAPPAPHVEIIPPMPPDLPDAVWIDGQWLLRGRRWEWEPGRWQVPPPGAGYAPPAVVYLSGGRIAWFAGAWAPAGGATPSRSPEGASGAPDPARPVTLAPP